MLAHARWPDINHCALATNHAIAAAGQPQARPRHCTTPSLSTSYGMGATVSGLTSASVKPSRGSLTRLRSANLSSRSAPHPVSKREHGGAVGAVRQCKCSAAMAFGSARRAQGALQNTTHCKLEPQARVRWQGGAHHRSPWRSS